MSLFLPSSSSFPFLSFALRPGEAAAALPPPPLLRARQQLFASDASRVAHVLRRAPCSVPSREHRGACRGAGGQPDNSCAWLPLLAHTHAQPGHQQPAAVRPMRHALPHPQRFSVVLCVFLHGTASATTDTGVGT